VGSNGGGNVKASTVLKSAVVTGLATVLAACSGQAPNSVATASDSSGWDINQTARQDLTSGEFTGAISDPLTNWNTYAIGGVSQEVAFLEAPINATYYDYNGVGDPIQNTDYLVSVKTELKPNLVVTLELNPKAVWNDGKVIDANDWIATWKALNGSNSQYEAASTDGWSEVRSITAGSSQMEVVITFTSTYPDWTSIVAGGPIRAEGAATPKAFNEWSDYIDAYFTGPYRVSSWDKTTGMVTMVPNPRWWGATPLLTKITWKHLTSDAMAAAFANQEIDYYDIGTDADGYARASAATNSVVRVASGPGYRQITFNSGSPNLVDVNVRQAIVMGLDRTLIAQSDLAGLPGSKQPLNNNLYRIGRPGYVDEAQATGLDYDVGKANQKLEDAGWKLNSATGYREKDGRELDLTFVAYSDVAASQNEGFLAQSMLKQIGIKVTVKEVSDTDLSKHEFDLIAFTWSNSSYPLGSLGQLYGGTVTNGVFTPSASNFAQLKIDKVLELKPKIDTEVDSAKRLELGQQAAEAIWTSVHTLPLYQRPMLVGVRAKLANIGAMGLARIPKWENVGYTK
jgi:peptide/nickel transport system substrate-binding protein